MVVEARRVDAIACGMYGIEDIKYIYGMGERRNIRWKLEIKQSDKQREGPREICDAKEERWKDL